MKHLKNKNTIKINKKIKNILWIGTSILFIGCIITFVGIILTTNKEKKDTTIHHVTFIFGNTKNEIIK